ncbi:MAG: DnaJ domain-containing protein [Bryobacterales bacterium]|nr:DnaJ domain-containing protein [Bryobacterales bacterium]
MTEERFVDYYELMQISPAAEPETIQRVFRMLAARYHPDNTQTGDLEKFLLLGQARDILEDPEKRAAYDALRQEEKQKPLAVFSLKEFAVGIDGEANRRLGVLCLLYHQRRVSPDKPSLSLLDLESIMSFPREHLVFTLWYLSEKHQVRRDETSNYVITAEGIDYVESKLSSNRVIYRLLKSAEYGSAASDDLRIWLNEEVIDSPHGNGTGRL